MEVPPACLLQTLQCNLFLKGKSCSWGWSNWVIINLWLSIIPVMYNCWHVNFLWNIGLKSRFAQCHQKEQNPNFVLQIHAHFSLSSLAGLVKNPLDTSIMKGISWKNLPSQWDKQKLSNQSARKHAQILDIYYIESSCIFWHSGCYFDPF